MANKSLAERGGFEPPIGLHLCRISSAVQSTTLPPLQGAKIEGEPPWLVALISEDGGTDKARKGKIRCLFQPRTSSIVV